VAVHVPDAPKDDHDRLPWREIDGLEGT